MRWTRRGNRRLRTRAAIAFSVGALAPSHDTSRQSPTSTIELTAVRAALGSRRPGLIIVDSVFARPDQAPPAMTAQIRPGPRQRMLTDSIQSLQVRGGPDTLRVRASEPVLRGDSATISVTIDGRSPGRRITRSFYETVRFVLSRDGARWVIRSRTQLGIT